MESGRPAAFEGACGGCAETRPGGRESGHPGKAEEFSGSGSRSCPKPDAVILREKDLSDDDYRRLAIQLRPMCRAAGIALILNGRPEIAVLPSTADPSCPQDALDPLADGLQLSFAAANARYGANGGSGKTADAASGAASCSLPFGVSVHSPEEAVEAEKFGASWLIYGHVFATDCKKGLAPRGLDALRRVCEITNIPVYAIGGIDDETLPLCIKAGAAGGCRMSGYMVRSERDR